MCFASACSAGAEMPSDLGTFTPKYAIFARTLGFASFFSSRRTAVLVHSGAFLCVPPRLECFAGIEEDCDWAFIHKLPDHIRLEISGPHVHAKFPSRSQNLFVTPFG